MNDNEQKLLIKSPDWEMRWFLFKAELGEKIGDFFRAIWHMLPSKTKYYINRFDMWIETGMIEIGHEKIDQAERIAAQEGKWTFRTRQMKYKSEMLVIRSTKEVKILKEKDLKYSD